MECNKLIADTSSQLSVTADKVADYHAEVGYKPIEKPTREDLELAEFWYFGALEAFLEETNSLEAEVKKVKDVGIKLNEHVRKVVSTMSKGTLRLGTFPEWLLMPDLCAYSEYQV